MFKSSKGKLNLHIIQFNIPLKPVYIELNLSSYIHFILFFKVIDYKDKIFCKQIRPTYLIEFSKPYLFLTLSLRAHFSLQKTKTMKAEPVARSFYTP